MTDTSAESAVASLLVSGQTIAVVGLSGDPLRPSFRVAAYMREAGCRVIPVNPKETQVLGERAYPDLAAVPDAIDLVVIFRRAEACGAIVEAAIQRRVRGVWLQEGIRNPEAVERAQAAGLISVMDRCWLKEHQRRRLSCREGDRIVEERNEEIQK